MNKLVYVQKLWDDSMQVETPAFGNAVKKCVLAFFSVVASCSNLSTRRFLAAKIQRFLIRCISAACFFKKYSVNNAP